MRRIYRTPPLIEALCEFQFQAGAAVGLDCAGACL